MWIFLKVGSQEDEESLDSKYIFSTWNICSSLSFPKFKLDLSPCFYGFSSCCPSYFDYKQTFQFSCFCASSIVLSLILGFSSFSLWSCARKILKGKATLWCLLIVNFTVLRQKYRKCQKPLPWYKWVNGCRDTQDTDLISGTYVSIWLHTCVYFWCHIYISTGGNLKTGR